jgi:hypothetical protein
LNKIIVPLCLAVLAAVPAMAQAPAAPAASPAPNAPVRITGALTAIGNQGLTIRDAAGVETKMGLAPSLTVVASRPVPKDQIKPGDFVASANLSQADGVGKSIEMRLFEPGSRAGEGNRPMTQATAAPGQMMTNATVTKVATTAAGLELDVQYPGGIRHLVVPPEVTIFGAYPVDPGTLTVGTTVTVTATRAADGALNATRIQIPAPAAR